MQKRAALVAYLKDNCPGFDPANGAVLEHLDSLSIVSLVNFIHSELAIELDLMSFDIDQFQSVDTLIDLLNSFENHSQVAVN